MMLYFEPQISYGIASPKIAEMSGLIKSVEDRDCTAALTHPAKQRVYKMASHGPAGKNKIITYDTATLACKHCQSRSLILFLLRAKYFLLSTFAVVVNS